MQLRMFKLLRFGWGEWVRLNLLVKNSFLLKLRIITALKKFEDTVNKYDTNQYQFRTYERVE
jgi:hypothetical protein